MNDEDVCSNCNHSIEDCECLTCTECGEHVDNLECCGETHCTDCCNCVHCGGCGRYNVTRFGRDIEICSDCEQCQHCCECIRCGSCGCVVDSTCGDCDNCPDCCGCEEGECGILTSGMFRFWPAGKTEHKINPFTRFIALEIEVASGNNNSDVAVACERWDDAIVSDGSLPDAGFEINTNPSSGDVFIRHIDDICAALDGASVTSACGLHCHIGANDYRWFDLFKLCALYSRIEDGLYMLVPASRRGNRYCQPCAEKFTFDSPVTFKGELLNRLYERSFQPKGADKPHSKERRKLKKEYLDADKKLNKAYTDMAQKSDAYYGMPWDANEVKRAAAGRAYTAAYQVWNEATEVRNRLRIKLGLDAPNGVCYKVVNGKEKKVFQEKTDKYNGARYTGLNIHSFFYRGTIEFRHHSGTVNADKAKNWGMICAAIIEYAAKFSMRDIKALPDDSWIALMAILPPFLQTYAEKRRKELRG